MRGLVYALFLPATAAFCESSYGGMFYHDGEAEIGNSITSFAMVYVAGHMLMAWDVDALMIKLIAALFATNCVGSFGYHGFKNARLGRLDFDTMLFAAWLGFIFFVEELVDNLVQQRIKRWDDEIVAPVKRRNNMRWVRLGMSLVWSVCALNIFYFLVDAPGVTMSMKEDIHYFNVSAEPQEFTLDNSKPVPGWTIRSKDGLTEVTRPAGTYQIDREKEKPSWYDFVFIAPLVGLVIGIAFMFYRKGLLDPTLRESKSVNRGREYFLIGITCAILGVLCQVINEMLCGTHEFWKRFPGHALWHLLMSYGLMCVLVIAVVLRADNHGASVVWFIDLPSVQGNRFKRVYFRIFPGLIYDTSRGYDAEFGASGRRVLGAGATSSTSDAELSPKKGVAAPAPAPAPAHASGGPARVHPAAPMEA
jgi:hypothetical protein